MPSAPLAREIVGNAMGVALMSYHIAFTHTSKMQKHSLFTVAQHRGKYT